MNNNDLPRNIRSSSFSYLDVVTLFEKIIVIYYISGSELNCYTVNINQFEITPSSQNEILTQCKGSYYDAYIKKYKKTVEVVHVMKVEMVVEISPRGNRARGDKINTATTAVPIPGVDSI